MLVLAVVVVVVLAVAVAVAAEWDHGWGLVVPDVAAGLEHYSRLRLLADVRRQHWQWCCFPL